MCPYETEVWNNKFALSWWEQVKFWRDDNNDDNVCFVLDWHSWQGVLDTWWSLSATKCGRSVVFSGTPVSSTNKTDHHHITEILLTVALNNDNPDPLY